MQELTFRPSVPVVAELVREASAGRETVGVLLHGSRTAIAQPGLDYDVIRVVSDREFERRRRSGTVRGRLSVAGDRSVEVVHQTLSSIERHASEPGASTAGYLYGRVVHDPTGDVGRLLDRVAEAAGRRARASVPSACDAYLEAFARSVKAARRHDQLGQRMEAAESARALVRVLFGLEGRWPPHLHQLTDEMAPVEHAQGWPAGYLRFALLQLLRDPAPWRQQELARRVDRLLTARGVSHDWGDRLEAVAAPARSTSGTRTAVHRRMSDARQSPIPQDRVNENVDQRQRAHDSKHDQRQRERHLEKQRPDDQPGMPGEPTGPAEGGD